MEASLKDLFSAQRNQPRRNLSRLPPLSHRPRRRKGRLESRPRNHKLSALFGWFFNAFAERVANEALDRDRRADISFSFLHRLSHGLGLVVDVRLVEQADFLVIGLQ